VLPDDLTVTFFSIGPQIGSIKALLDSKLALFQRIHVFELTSGVSEATKAELDKVKVSIY
jgi:hypothetical protein